MIFVRVGFLGTEEIAMAEAKLGDLEDELAEQDKTVPLEASKALPQGFGG